MCPRELWVLVVAPRFEDGVDDLLAHEFTRGGIDGCVNELVVTFNACSSSANIS